MMCVELMKNCYLADWNNLMAFWPTSFSWAQKRLIPNFRYDVRRVDKKILSRRFERSNGCQTNFFFLTPKTLDSDFLEVMYLELMKNFHLAESNEVMAVRLISGSWAQKRLILIFRHNVHCAREKFFLFDQNEVMAVRLISASWARQRLILIF